MKSRGITLIGLLAILATGAALAVGVKSFYRAQLDAAGKAAVEQYKLEQKAAENTALRMQAERIATLSNDLMEAQSAHAKAIRDLSVARSAAAAAGERLRVLTERGELESRIARAEREVLNTVAARAIRAAKAGRDAVAEIGLGAGGLVESAASAHHEHARAEALMRARFPRLPNPGKE